MFPFPEPQSHVLQIDENNVKKKKNLRLKRQFTVFEVTVLKFHTHLSATHGFEAQERETKTSPPKVKMDIHKRLGPHCQPACDSHMQHKSLYQGIQMHSVTISVKSLTM